MKRLSVGVCLLLCTAACESPPPPVPPEPCGVTVVEQALQFIAPSIAFVLDESLGGQRCVPGIGAACTDAFAQCFAELPTTPDTTTNVVISVQNTGQVTATIASVAVDGDCGWSVVDTGEFRVDVGATVPVEVTFAAGAVGSCDADFVLVSDAGNVPGETSEVRIPLRATVVAAE